MKKKVEQWENWRLNSGTVTGHAHVVSNVVISLSSACSFEYFYL